MADVAALETIPGTEQGSHYFVIAKSQNLILGVRPIIFVKKDDKVFHLGARLRAINENLDGDVSTAATVFNFPEGFSSKEKHASIVCGMPVTHPPFSPNELNTIIKEHDLVSKFAEDILNRLIENEIKPLVTKEVLVEILNLTYDTQLTEVIKKPIEHKTVFGLQ